MKKKAIVTVLACIMLLAAIGIGNAAPGYYTCTVNRAGAATYGYWVELTDTNAAFTSMFFLIDQSVTGMAQAMYAAALSGWANSNNVLIYADPTSGSAIFLLAAVK